MTQAFNNHSTTLSWLTGSCSVQRLPLHLLTPNPAPFLSVADAFTVTQTFKNTGTLSWLTVSCSGNACTTSLTQAPFGTSTGPITCSCNGNSYLDVTVYIHGESGGCSGCGGGGGGGPGGLGRGRGVITS